MVSSRTEVLIVDDDDGARLTIKHIVESASIRQEQLRGGMMP
ncbi:hypothetical protein VT98_10503 [Candidatus Electrothrix communis]|uniref:Uncharacterized protein n=1 Tax=Candidatus Electrothrix communis TaxID=1859133 RepID=A0A444J8R8_9BACT|nr:hypothetical protein VT98_10503 [Candidatus Electrothrix communis]